MINLIPMAGAGSRFQDEGYIDPKPLIQVAGNFMVTLASKFLPKADKWIYICKSEHIDNYQIDKILKKQNESTSVLTVDKLTEGQASTCLLAKDLIDNDEELMIAASDNGMLWDEELFNSLRNEADCLIWTFRNNVTVNEKPAAYGWVDVDETGQARKVSVKVPISTNYSSDHAVVGAFWFKKGQLFVTAAESMIAKNRRVNNEFYVDEAINELIELGYKVKVMEIEKYICWGTPNDLRTFNYWQSFFYIDENFEYRIEKDIYYGK